MKHRADKGITVWVLETNPAPELWQKGDSLEVRIGFHSLTRPGATTKVIRISQEAGFCTLQVLGYDQQVSLGDLTQEWKGLEFEIEKG